MERAKRLQAALARVVCQMVDSHEQYTGGHSERVGEYARIVAIRLGLAEEECFAAFIAGLVHDLGKVGIEAEVLGRPARLNAAMWAAMEAHPVIGFDVLRTAGADPHICVPVLEHHRRIDGTGYPPVERIRDRLDQLAGRNSLVPAEPRPVELSLVGQILGLVDSFDAMTTPRPYMGGGGRDTFSEALAKLRSDARPRDARLAPSYNPLLVEALAQGMEELWRVFDRHIREGKLSEHLRERNLAQWPGLAPAP